jgi:hypothetical protein
LRVDEVVQIHTKAPGQGNGLSPTGDQRTGIAVQQSTTLHHLWVVAREDRPTDACARERQECGPLGAGTVEKAVGEHRRRVWITRCVRVDTASVDGFWRVDIVNIVLANDGNQVDLDGLDRKARSRSRRLCDTARGEDADANQSKRGGRHV